jgi:phosphomannomutase
MGKPLTLPASARFALRHMTASIQELMARTGVKFGTSGARGLATQLTDFVAYAYTQGFLQHLRESGDLTNPKSEIAVGGDFRPSTDRIMEAVLRAVEDLGYVPVNCGKIPSPALALHGLLKGIPAIMVTGSHIPSDRNGIKFNKCAGEVLKDDEAGITKQVITVADDLFTADGAFAKVGRASSLPQATMVKDEGQAGSTVLLARSVRVSATEDYVARYLEFFPNDCLKGLRLGVYQHSAVGRDVIAQVLAGLGAEVTPLGRSETFIPVDTEAIRPEDVELARGWAQEHRFDAIASADGDSDRPLISDEHGKWIRGDVAGVLCARYLAADSVSTPVSCNSAVDLSGWFPEVKRTKIGSPFVVASMLDAAKRGIKCVVGYEANGGFLLNSPITRDGRTLRALPTRDALILIISLLLLARREGKTLSQLVATLPPRYTASGLLKECPVEKSQAILARFTTGDEAKDKAALAAAFGGVIGSSEVTAINRTDGVRVTFGNGEIVHLRPSGNAPEFRCYTEASGEARATELNDDCMAAIAAMVV